MTGSPAQRMKDLVRYDKNPFVLNLQTAQKRRTLTSAQYGMAVDEAGNAVIENVTFSETHQVDKEKFVKLFVAGANASAKLTPAGYKVFTHLLFQVRKTKERDEIHLSRQHAKMHDLDIDETTFRRGILNLVNNDFIRPTQAPTVFFINPNYLFNGNRVTYVRNYVLKEPDGDAGPVQLDVEDFCDE